MLGRTAADQAPFTGAGGLIRLGGQGWGNTAEAFTGLMAEAVLASVPAGGEGANLENDMRTALGIA